MIRINLAPETKRRGIGFKLPTLPAFNLGWLFLIVYLAAVAGIGTYWWALSSEEADLTAKVDGATKELAQLKAAIGQGSQVKDQAAELRKRLAVLEELTKGQTRPILLVDAFASLVPKDLWITRSARRDSRCPDRRSPPPPWPTSWRTCARPVSSWTWTSWFPGAISAGRLPW